MLRGRPSIAQEMHARADCLGQPEQTLHILNGKLETMVFIFYVLSAHHVCIGGCHLRLKERVMHLKRATLASQHQCRAKGPCLLSKPPKLVSINEELTLPGKGGGHRY